MSSVVELHQAIRAVLERAPRREPDLAALVKIAHGKLQEISAACSLPPPEKTGAAPAGSTAEQEPTAVWPRSTDDLRSEDLNSVVGWPVDPTDDDETADVIEVDPDEQPQPRQVVQPPDVPAVVPAAVPVPEPSALTEPPPENAQEFGRQAKLLREQIEGFLRARSSPTPTSRFWSRLTTFLREFELWSRGARSTGIAAVLNDCAERVRELAAQSGVLVILEVDETEGIIDAELGRFLTALVGDIFAVLFSTGKRPREYKILISAEAKEGRICLRMAGAVASAHPMIRLRVHSLRDRLERLGGRLLFGDEQDRSDLVLDIPRALQSIEVIMAGAGDDYVALPTSFVKHCEPYHTQCVRRVGGEPRYELDEDTAPLLDLNPVNAPGTDERVAILAEHAGHRCVIVVDRVLERQQVLMLPAANESGHWGMLGYCWFERNDRMIPVLDFPDRG